MPAEFPRMTLLGYCCIVPGDRPPVPYCHPPQLETILRILKKIILSVGKIILLVDATSPPAR